ncbi:site-2 protease family protein [Iamia sp. SCSIO 61187]|uniref:M50 family metallopeptidase n=1 Tax=Iamia sp. SCSIO 61187 TaxID=2722752 RepID=UPI001C637C89|nr:site-2 protease family protein [Iamia sp. SCSIO 61187]QYG92654.1 site-2 protease family protein [Iamia sp. SCSIO 61187]
MTAPQTDPRPSPAEPPRRPAEAVEQVAGEPDGQMTLGQWVRLGVVAALLVVLTASTGVYGLLMVLGIVVMITLHELGHFVMARRAGMKCTEFFLGFGPKIWSVRRGETEYGLKLIPAGAYVKIVGMHDIEEVDPADEPKTYRQQPFWQRFGVAVAGSTVHFVLALGLIYALLVGFGLSGGSITDRYDAKWRVGSVSEDSAAAEAGLQEGDDVVAIDGERLATFEDLRQVVADKPEEQVVLTVARDGEEREVAVTLGRNPDDAEVGFLGIGQTIPVEKLGVVEGIPATVREFGSVAKLSVEGLGNFFTPSGISDYSRQVRDARDEPAATSSDAPSSSSAAAEDSDANENRLLSLLGVFRIGVDAGETGGVASLVLLFAFINIFIGLFNLVPLLPFDGGHVVIAIYEKVQEWRRRDGRRYLADVGKLIPMTYAVVFVLGLIFVSSLYLDLVNPAQVN